jgi:hypothetical protein
VAEEKPQQLEGTEKRRRHGIISILSLALRQLEMGTLVPDANECAPLGGGGT